VSCARVELKAQDAGYCHNFQERLPVAVALSSKTWNPDRSSSLLELLQPWSRPDSQLNIGAVTFIPPSRTWEISKPHGSLGSKNDCGNKIINAFEIQSATYYSILGWSRDICDGNPGLRWVSAAGKTFEIDFPAAYASNIKAVWCLKDYFAFGFGMWHQSYIRESNAIGLWNIKTGSFHFVPLILTEMGYVSKWSGVQAAEGDGVVVFKSSGSAFAYWPETHKAAPLDLPTWSTPAQDTLISVKEVLQLFPEIATKEFIKISKALTDVYPLRPAIVKLSGKNGSEEYYCICAQAQNPEHRDFEGSLSFEDNAKHSQVGCFLMPKKRPTKILKLDIVPTRRWLDYTASCSSGKGYNELVLYFCGDTYADQGMTRRYQVNPDAWTVGFLDERADK